MKVMSNTNKHKDAVDFACLYLTQTTASMAIPKPSCHRKCTSRSVCWFFCSSNQFSNTNFRGCKEGRSRKRGGRRHHGNFSFK
jgi:hypothetical protein